MEESQGQTAQAYFPEQVREHSPSHGKDNSLHERMVVPPVTDVYLEIVETAEDMQAETDRLRITGMSSL